MEMEWKWNGNGMEMEWKWNGNEMTKKDVIYLCHFPLNFHKDLFKTTIKPYVL